MDIIEKAKLIAMVAHDAVGQKRKYTGEPYWVHPQEVAQIVESVGGSPEMIAAAHLHDVLEDTDMTADQLVDLVGPVVTDLVLWLTDISKPEDGNRKTRKAIDRDHIAKAPAMAKTIKLADLLSNTDSITKHDRAFAKVYMAEKELLLKVLRGGDPTLWDRANAHVTLWKAGRHELVEPK